MENRLFAQFQQIISYIILPKYVIVFRMKVYDPFIILNNYLTDCKYRIRCVLIGLPLFYGNLAFSEYTIGIEGNILLL